MQQLSSALTAALIDIDARVTPRVLVDLYEFYPYDYVPGPSGFDPADAVETFASEEITHNGIAYRREVVSRGDIVRNFGEKTNSVSLTFSNISRYMATLAQAQQIEGLFLVIRTVVPSVTDDSIVLFVGRCDKPSDIDKKSFSLSARQDFGNINQEIPPRTFNAEDPNGRTPSDPLYEGFRIVATNGTFPVSVTTASTSFFGRLLGKKKTETQTRQWSSLDETPYGSVVPIVFGRCQIELIWIMFADIGYSLIGVAAVGEGRVDDFTNVKLRSEEFTIATERDAYGDPGGTGTNNYAINPSIYPQGAIQHGYLSKTAYTVLSIRGSEGETVDDAPTVTALVKGVRIPVPNSSGVFDSEAWSDNPVAIARFILTDPRLVGINPGFMEDEVNYETFLHCEEPLIDDSNGELTLIPTPDVSQLGSGINRYRSTGIIDTAYTRRYLLEEPVDPPEWEDPPIEPFDPGDIPTTFPVTRILRKRYTINVPITEKVRAVDFLYKVIFPAAKLFLRINKRGKYEIRSEQPSDATMLRSSTAVGDTSIPILDVTPWKTGPDGLTQRLLLGFGLTTSEVRNVSSADYSTSGNSVTLVTAVTGTITATRSGVTLSGGSTSTPASGTVTIGGTPAPDNMVTVTIDGIAIVYTLNDDDTTGTVAAMLAAYINATPQLRRYIKATWDSGSPTVITLTCKHGVLNFGTALSSTVAFWKMELSGGSTADSIGGRVLSAVGSPTSVAGKIGNATGNLKGTNYLTGTGLYNVGGEWMIWFWCKRSSAETHTIVCGEAADLDPHHIDFTITWSVEDAIHVAIADAPQSLGETWGNIHTADNSIPSDGNWHLVVVSMSALSGGFTTLQVVIDNQSPVTQSVNELLYQMGDLGTPLYVGNGRLTTGGTVSHSIDALGIRYAVPTADDLAYLWNSGRGIEYPFAVPFLKAHTGPIADPTTTPSLSSSAGDLEAGTYKLAYSDVTAIGQTALSPQGSIVIVANKQIDVGAIALVGTSRNWFMSDAANSEHLKFIASTNGSAFSINALPLPNAAIPRGYNTTGEELIRVAMSFTTNSQDVYPVWSANTPVLINTYWLSSEPNGHVYKVTTAGTTGATEPTWPTSAGSTVASGTAVFTEYQSTVLQQTGNTRANIKKDTFKWPLGSKQSSVNQVKGNYRDSNNDFALTPFKVNDPIHQAKVGGKVYPLEVDLSAVDNSHQKERIANWQLAKNREGDWFNSLETGPQGLVLEEGDVICSSDDSGGLVNVVTRIEEIRIHKNHDVSIAQARKYSTLMFADEVGADAIPIPSTLRYTQTVNSIIEFIDNFPIRDSDALVGGFYVDVSRDLNDVGDWRGWVLYADYGDGYLEIARGDIPAIMGVATTTLGTVSDPFSGIDRTHSVTFTLSYGPPAPFANPFPTVTEAEMKANSRRNLFLVGDEYIQAATIVDNGDQSYTLSNLLRGRFGTDSHQLTHAASERVVFLDGAERLVTIDPVRLNSEYNYKVVTTNQSISDASAVPFTWTGGTIKPVSPGGLKGSRNANLDLLIEWKYRASTSLGMSPNADVPLSDDEQRYLIQIYDGSSLKREARNSTALVAQKADWLPYSGTTYFTLFTAFVTYVQWTDAGQTTSLVSSQKFHGDFIFEFSAGSGFLPSVIGIVPVGVNPETDYATHPHFSNNAGGLQVARPMGDANSLYQWTYVTSDRFSIHRTGDVVKFYANYLSPATVPLYEITYNSSREMIVFASFVTGVGASGILASSQIQFKNLYAYSYTRSQQVEDFGSTQNPVKVRVTRLSPVVGPGDYSEKLL